MLSYYKKAVKDGWKPPVYKAEVVLQGENKERLTIPFEGGYYELILFIAKYLKSHADENEIYYYYAEVEDEDDYMKIYTNIFDKFPSIPIIEKFKETGGIYGEEYGSAMLPTITYNTSIKKQVEDALDEFYVLSSDEFNTFKFQENGKDYVFIGNEYSPNYTIVSLDAVKKAIEIIENNPEEYEDEAEQIDDVRDFLEL